VSSADAAAVSSFHLVSKTATVLLVDDDPIILRCHIRSLNDEFLIETCSNGPDALRRLMEGHIDVVVSDVCMPEMTGFELLSAIRQSDPRLPVILASASPTTDANQAMSDEVFVYLSKPVDGAMFRAAVRLAVQYRRSPKTERPRAPLSRRPSAAPSTALSDAPGEGAT
jgi:DNA-binding NtrC family response regulator